MTSKKQQSDAVAQDQEASRTEPPVKSIDKAMRLLKEREDRFDRGSWRTSRECGVRIFEEPAI